MKKFRIACAAAALSVAITQPIGADQLDQYYVRVSVDQIKAGYQRGKSPDHDYLTIYGTSTHDLSSKFTSGPIDVGTFTTNTQKAPSPNIMTDEFLVTGGDTIQIFADIQNKSHTDPSKAVSDGLKIAGATLAVLAAGDVLAAQLSQSKGLTQLLGNEANVIALSGAVLALGGEVIGDVGGWLGLSEPDCDGPVFAPTKPLLLNVGQFMGKFPGPVPLNTPLGFSLWLDDSQPNGDGCGHAPSATIRVNLVLTRPPIPAPTLSSFGPPTHFKPILSGISTEKLIGINWADGSFIEGSRVLATARATDNFHRQVGASGMQQFQLLRKQSPQLLELVGQPPAGRPAIPGMLSSVTFDVQENAAASPQNAIHISGASSPAIPIQVNAFSGNKFASTSAVSGALQGAVPTKSKVAAAPSDSTFHRTTGPSQIIGTGNSASAGPIKTKVAPPATDPAFHRTKGPSPTIAAKGSVSFADSFVLPNNVTLQIYGAYDAQERFVGTRLRYLRIDSAGNIATDAMLEPAQHTPR